MFLNTLKEIRNKIARNFDSQIDPIDKIRTKVSELRTSRDEFILTYGQLSGELKVLTEGIIEDKSEVKQYDEAITELAEQKQHNKAKRLLSNKLAIENHIPTKEGFKVQLTENVARAKAQLDKINLALDRLKIKEAQISTQLRLAKANNNVADINLGDVNKTIDELIKDAEVDAISQETVAEVKMEINDNPLEEINLEKEYSKYTN